MPFQPPDVAKNAHDVPTLCVLCSHNCGLRVDVEDNVIVEVRADDKNLITRGYSCNKAYSIAHYNDHAQRVKYPMKRQPGGGFSRITWDQAIAEIAERLGAIRQKYTGKAISLIGVGGQANHMDGPFALAFLRGLGSPWWFNALAQEKTQHALVDRWLFDAPPRVYYHPDIEHSDYVLMIGTNPWLSNRGSRATDTIRELSSDPGRTLIVVDPRVTETAKRANAHLQVRPGSDVYLLLGMARHIVINDLHDRAFTDRHVGGLDALRSALSDIDVDDMAGRCGIEPLELEALATAFAKAKSACIAVDLGLEQSRFSTLTAYLMRVLAALTGNVGNRGGNVFLGLFSPDLPIMDKEPFRAPVSGIEAIPMWTPFGMFSPNLFPEEVLDNGDRDRIRAAIVEGANPAVQSADCRRQRQAFEALDLLVVIDPAFTETAQHAHYVLPTPTGYEKWEYAGFPKGFPEIYAHLRPPVVEGPKEALPEAEIYYRLARAMGLVEPASRIVAALGKQAGKRNGAAALAAAPAYLAAATSAAVVKDRDRNAILARLLFWTYETVGDELPSPALVYLWATCMGYAMRHRDEVVRAHPQTPHRNPFSLGNWLFDTLIAHPEGVQVGALDESKNLADTLRHSDGRIALSQPAMFGEIRRALAEKTTRDEDYPLILDGGMRTHWNANTIQRNPAWRKGKGPHCAVLAHPDDAAAAGVEPGQNVVVESPTGSVTLPLSTSDGVKPGHIHIPNGFGLSYPDQESGEPTVTGVCINELTDASARDPFTGCPHHKYVPCRMRPANPSS